MKLSKSIYIQKFCNVLIATFVNMFLITSADDDNISFILFLAVLLNSLLLFMYSFSWLPDIWASETYLTSSIFGFKRNHGYEDIVKISETNYRFRIWFKRYTPIQLTFRDQKTLKFIPNKDGLTYLLDIVKEKSLPVKIDL